MTLNGLQTAALLLDRAAAETPELDWIAPLMLIKARALALSEAGESHEGEAMDALLDPCERLARAASEGTPIPPDAVIRALFALYDIACSEIGEQGPEALRGRCAECAELLRAVRAAKPLFRRAWRSCPEAVRREEEAAYDRGQAELATALEHLLAVCQSAIRAESVHARSAQARAAHEALAAVPAIARIVFIEGTTMSSEMKYEATSSVTASPCHLPQRGRLLDNRAAEIRPSPAPSEASAEPASAARRARRRRNPRLP